MNKNLKYWGLGVGTAGINILSSTNIFSRVPACTGACGSCGMNCVAPLIGVTAIGLTALARYKLKGKKFSTDKVNLSKDI